MQTAVSARNPWLDLVRATAILLVLVAHGRAFLLETLPWAATLKVGGFLGVELFFVLSGFLIGGLLLQLSADLSMPALRVFLMRRWLRTLPNYYLFLVLNLGLALTLLGPVDLSDVALYVVFAQNLFSAHPGFFPEAWSLSVEEVFYLGFPLLGLLCAALLRCPATRVLWWLGVAVLALSTLGRFWVAAEPGVSWDADIRKVVWLRLDALMLGVLAAFYRGVGGQLLEQTWLRLLLLLLLAGSGLYAWSATHAELDASYFAKTLLFNTTSLGCLGLVLVGLRWRLPAGLAAPAGFFARISFSCYLVNLPVLALLGRFAGHLAPLQQLGLFFGLTIGASWLVYRFWELRFLRLRERHSAAPAPVAAAAP